MHEERLRRLQDFLLMAEAHASDCRAAAEDAEALVRDTRVAIAKETKERRHLRGLPLLFPAALAATGAAWRWAGRNSAGVAAFGAGAAISAAAAVGVVQLSDDPPPARHVVTAPAPPPASPSRAGHTPTPTRPPKDSPTPAPPSAAPAPTPTMSSPDVPPPASGSEPSKTKPPKTHKPPKPPHTPPGKPSTPPAGDAPVTTKDDCRIHLLGIGMLCGRLLNSEQTPIA